MANFLTLITSYLWTQSWQIAILAVIIAMISVFLKNKSAHVRYLLWLILPAKCLIPPLFTIPLAILPQDQIVQSTVESSNMIPSTLIGAPGITAVEPTDYSTSPLAVPTNSGKSSAITLSQRLGVGWIFGASIFVLVALIKAWRVDHRLRRQRKPLAVDLQENIMSLFTEINNKKFPKIWLVDGIGQPFVWGLLRGSIYLPCDFSKIESVKHRRGILSHELSHVLRFDAMVNLLQIIAQAVFWFHPLVWWANKKIRIEREKCCDEMAVAWFGTEVRDFSNAIVNILTTEYKSTQTVPSLAIAGPVRNIEDRIKTMMNPGRKFYKQPSLFAAVAVLFIGLTVVPITLALTPRANKEADESRRSSFEGLVQFDQNIPIQLNSAEDPPMVKCEWIKFERSNNSVVATLQTKLSSGPKANWKFRLRLLDTMSKEIIATSSILENSGIIKGVVVISDEQLHFELGDLNSIEKAKKFEVGITWSITGKGGGNPGEQRHIETGNLNTSVNEYKSGVRTESHEDTMSTVAETNKTIVPGLRVGDYTFRMSKDEVLEKLGEPKEIFYGDKRYTLDDLPEKYFMHYGDISFEMTGDLVTGITALSPSYKFSNGLRVGDSEKEIKAAFGEVFSIREFEYKDFLEYENQGLMFEIHKQDRIILEINVFLPNPEVFKKAKIPPTSHINEKGHIVDKIDYPFVNDPEVLGGWKSVDFVENIGDFNPTKKSWEGELFLNHLIFESNGTIRGGLLTWTKGLVFYDNDFVTASKYQIKKIDDSEYMFYEWKSGDYSVRHQKTSYYVLKRVLAESLKYEPMFGEKADIPPTSTFDKDGRLIDKTDYPFIDDPQVIGTWKSVDFVSKVEEFKVNEKQWRGRGGELFLKELIFLPDGKTFKPWLTWTKGLVFHSGDRTASKYVLKDMDGSTYMFFEWKSGDYTIRYRKPSYYVLKKISSGSMGLSETWISQPSDTEFAEDLSIKIEQLDIDIANLEQVKRVFGKPAQYIWGTETFTEDNLPERFILVYPSKFHIYMNEDRIIELRHESGSDYDFRNKLRSGSTLEEAFEVIGYPQRIIEGKKNRFKDGVLYKDIKGRKGYCYYARTDHNVRLWFLDYKIIAIYMTRSDYGTSPAPPKGRFGIKLDENSWPAVDVIPGMPSAKAGMQNGDRILKINGKDIAHMPTIHDALRVLNDDDIEKVEFAVQRDEKILELVVERLK